ncbi:PVC-type heme-binding CxxCH protein [Cyclobacterium jeungdonense]|uniref:HEAT repeat domain-containing protein n=1 Tax=Cyclobacterium jeungdonense TaxID=708087 RepID=A0ABT8CAT5_9BACT|nr:PVC-type heme-binding CxxCH protein [Cyclobacterium jeungdonense]MDN3689914.1 HEAT repeat domain-containing protein [Cyclobacterium jeungdonense]
MRHIRKKRFLAWPRLEQFLIILFSWVGFFGCTEPGMDQEAWELPDGYFVEEATEPGLVRYPMFAVFDDQGRLFVMESSGQTEGTEAIMEKPDFSILLLTDSDQDGVFDQKTIYVDSIPFPMGGAYVNGSLIVTASPNLVKFTDTDGDGMADEKEILLSGWTLNHNAAILSGPFLGPDGWLYMADARRGFDILSKEFVHFEGKGARIWRCLPNGTQLQAFAGGGFDNAIELAFTPSGEVLGTMTYFTDPRGGYRDALMHWVENGVYPKPHPVIEEDGLVQTGELMPVMHRMARVSPSGLMRHNGSDWGGEFEGDLFHAEFNTGRVIHTKLSPEGASFQAESQPFFQSKIPDFHPTDVLQEPNGNLLLVNTGGWFIAGCPLSRTAKPDVPGGIYRIRKNEKKGKVADPWGNTIPWEELSVGQLAKLLEDPRTEVAQKAGNYMLKQPLLAIPFLQTLMREHPDEQVRVKSVFLLFRTQNPRAWNQLYVGLDDPSDVVKTATARVLGMAEVITARDRLIQLLDTNPALPVAKQVATALGQIGDPKATKPLLRALESYPYDRYFEHTAIFALIEMKNEDLLLEELAASGFNKAILIALDQKGKDLLTEEMIAPYLISQDSTEMNTAAWILKKHPYWSRSFITFLDAFSVENSKEEQVLRELWPSFIDQESVQVPIAEKLSSYSGQSKLILSMLASFPPKKIGPSLNSSLRQYLKEKDNQAKEAALQVAIQLGTNEFTQELEDIAGEDTEKVAVRLMAYQGLVGQGEKVSEQEFQWITLQLLNKDRYSFHSSVLRIVKNLPLDHNRMDWILDRIFPELSVELIPSVLQIFEGVRQPAVLNKLEQQLFQRKEVWDNLSIGLVNKIFPDGNPALLDSLEGSQDLRLRKLESVENSLVQGDVSRGRELFFGKGTCGTCHAVAGDGGDFGPDLTNIGEIRSRHDILEAILYPASSFAREYETVSIRTSSQQITGIIKTLEEGRYEIALGPGVTQFVNEQDVVELIPTTQSLMPAGLENTMNTQELSDLMLYLQSLPDGMYTRTMNE